MGLVLSISLSHSDAGQGPATHKVLPQTQNSFVPWDKVLGLRIWVQILAVSNFQAICL